MYMKEVKNYILLSIFLLITATINKAELYLKELAEHAVDAFIVSDPGVLSLVREIIPEANIISARRLTVQIPKLPISGTDRELKG